MSGKRDYNREYQDTETRKYAYNFDGVLRRYMIRAFEPLMPGGRALELGCFEGGFTELLAPYYRELTVVEASSDLVEAAKRRVGASVRFVASRFEDASLPEGGFDAAFLIHTLEHIDDPASVLRKVGRWLSEKGRLFIAVPNANAASRQIAVKMGLISHNAAVTDGEFAQGHRRTYTFDTLERDVAASGLPILHRGGVFFKPLANFQFDKLMGGDIVSEAYLEGCYKLGMQYPDLCASIFVVCSRGTQSW
jgi:2-polyprenyl-3-methyl-5-hydroxy-6-metoxy-1,4-benzoquinol methylase